MRLEYYDMQDMYESVIKFNIMAKSIAPLYSCRSEEFYTRLKQQLALVQEELNEALQSIENKDNPELIKELVDIGVVWMGAMGVMRSAGFQIQDAMEKVCENNLNKILDSKEEAEESIKALAEKGVEAYIEEVFYFGDTYYALRRKSDGKILKPYFFKKLDVSEYVPTTH